MATRVLYVDDEPDLREIARLGLELDPGLEVSTCASGQEAVETIERWAPDIALLDVMMPGMDGPATLARLRETPAGSRLPVIFVTAVSQSRGIEPLLALGAVGVIDKPFDPMTLASDVSAYLARATEHEAAGFEQHFNTVRKQFEERLVGRAASLRLLADRPSGDEAGATEVKRLAHELAGSCGTFGFPELGEAAASLEEAADRVLAGGGEDLRPPLQGLVRALDATLAGFTRA